MRRSTLVGQRENLPSICMSPLCSSHSNHTQKPYAWNRRWGSNKHMNSNRIHIGGTIRLPHKFVDNNPQSPTSRLLYYNWRNCCRTSHHPNDSSSSPRNHLGHLGALGPMDLCMRSRWNRIYIDDTPPNRPRHKFLHNNPQGPTSSLLYCKCHNCHTSHHPSEVARSQCSQLGLMGVVATIYPCMHSLRNRMDIDGTPSNRPQYKFCCSNHQNPISRLLYCSFQNRCTRHHPSDVACSQCSHQGLKASSTPPMDPNTRIDRHHMDRDATKYYWCKFDSSNHQDPSCKPLY